jgi:hypothetical protein
MISILMFAAVAAPAQAQRSWGGGGEFSPVKASISRRRQARRDPGSISAQC